jgi:hypothetical protein
LKISNCEISPVSIEFWFWLKYLDRCETKLLRAFLKKEWWKFKQLLIRVLQNDRGVKFKDTDDVVVMNQHRVSQSNYMGTYYGRYARFGMGNTQSRSKTIGDVVFIRQGIPVIRFNQILMELQGLQNL